MVHSSLNSNSWIPYLGKSVCNKCLCTRILKDWAPLSPIRPTMSSGRLFQIETAVCKKLLPVECWVLDVGSSRAWLVIERLERVARFTLYGGGSMSLRSARQRLVCISFNEEFWMKSQQLAECWNSDGGIGVRLTRNFLLFTGTFDRNKQTNKLRG